MEVPVAEQAEADMEEAAVFSVEWKKQLLQEKKSIMIEHTKGQKKKIVSPNGSRRTERNGNDGEKKSNCND